MADDVPRLALGGKALSIDKTHVRAESARHDLCQATRQIVAAPVLGVKATRKEKSKIMRSLMQSWWRCESNSPELRAKVLGAAAE